MKTTQILKANHISKNGLTIFADMDIGLLNADRQKKEDNLNRPPKYKEPNKSSHQYL